MTRVSYPLVLGGLLLLGAGTASGQPYSPDIGWNPTGLSSGPGCGLGSNPLMNCGFEDGDFTSWSVADLTDPFFGLIVGPDGVSAWSEFFASDPTEGSFAALHGFDGNGPGVITIAQDVALPAEAERVRFDYRGAWDLASFGATLDRTFRVDIEPAGGGAPLQSTVVLTAEVGTIVTDTGDLSSEIDLGDFAGETVRLSFEWLVPEDFSGPGFFQLDNVEIILDLPTPTVDSSWSSIKGQYRQSATNEVTE